MSLSNFSLSLFIHFLLLTSFAVLSYFSPRDVAPVLTQQISLNYLGSISPDPKIEEIKEIPIIQEKKPEIIPEIPKKIIKREKIVKKQLPSPKVVSEERTEETPAQIEQISAKQNEEFEKKKAQARYRDVFLAKILEEKTYPEKARKRGIEGEGIVQVLIGPEGQVLRSTIVDSSGSALLDQEILSLIQRSAPFPKLPRDLQDFSAKLPIQFRLSK